MTRARVASLKMTSMESARSTPQGESTHRDRAPPMMEGVLVSVSLVRRKRARRPLLRQRWCRSILFTNAPPIRYVQADITALNSHRGAVRAPWKPMVERAGFNEACGDSIACEAGLLCVSDMKESYCSQPCEQGLCPQALIARGYKEVGTSAPERA